MENAHEGILVKIDVDTTELDDAMVKATRLAEKLEEVKGLIGSLAPVAPVKETANTFGMGEVDLQRLARVVDSMVPVIEWARKERASQKLRDRASEVGIER